METTELLQNITSLKELSFTFENGDLLSIIELGENFKEIKEVLDNQLLSQSASASYNRIKKTIDTIEDCADQENALHALAADFDSLIVFYDPGRQTQSQKTATAGQEAVQAQIQVESQPESKVKHEITGTKKDAAQELAEKTEAALEPDRKSGELYPEGYFTGIIDDQEMMVKFCGEAKEHLDNAQFSLVDLEYDYSNQESINNIFRSFHTIKGSSAFLGIKNLEEIAHEVESLFSLVRDGKLKVSSELIDVIFFEVTKLRELIDIIEVNNFEIEPIVDCFKTVDIQKTIEVVKNILKHYQTRKIGDILEDLGKINSDVKQHILKREETEDKRFGEIALEEKVISEDDLKTALKIQNTAKERKTSYVKVSNDRLNLLVDMVGELVVTQSVIKDTMHMGTISSNVEERALKQLESITTNIKNIVLSMGMVPISEIFNKLRVVLRNISRELGKMVDVELYGEDTELDRNVVQTIYDPFVHLVRNAVDHGLEIPEEREKAGKHKLGKIKLSAVHKGSGIEISIYDDGKGINKDKVLKKAISRGLVSEEAAENLSDKEIFSFMFMPGFSTAEKVTEVSGRGVGLDVVKKNIEQIHGKIEIQTQEHKYTKFIIKLPLTLAIIDGFVTALNNKKYILPFSLIEEIIVPEKENIDILDDGQMMLYNRQKYIPIIFAGQLFNEETYEKEINKIIVIIISYEGASYGIAVDSVMGKQEIVIKNLSEALHSRLKYFSGGTIFGDGSIGFVVDIDQFMEIAKKKLSTV